MNYPNLVELYRYHPYHYSTFAEFAGVTPELFLEALRGNEELTLDEFRRIARFTHIPAGVLSCPHLIMLDRHRLRHREMIDRQSKALYQIWEYQKNGSRAADRFMKGQGRHELVNLHLAFMDTRATYGRYLGVQDMIDQCFLSIEVEKRRQRVRGLGRCDVATGKRSPSGL